MASNTMSPLSSARMQEPYSSAETNTANFKAAAEYYKGTTERSLQIVEKQAEQLRQIKPLVQGAPKSENVGSKTIEKVITIISGAIGTAATVVSLVKSIKK